MPKPDHSRATNPYLANSPFWPLISVFATLIFLQTVYLIEDLRGRSNIKDSQTALRKTLDQAEAISKTAENVGRELLSLSADKSQEADKIIAEFNIKLNAPPHAQ